ncbi:MAG: ATP-dependent DNA helicase [Actinomycetota bacterium]
MTAAAKKAARLLERVLAHLENAEHRDGQAEMVRHVADTIEAGGTLVIQAGTGTGKTLGYLIPILTAGQTAVIATYTKALQDQLASVDLPMLQAVCADDDELAFTWAVLKGRNNYLCRQRASEIETGSDQLDLDDVSATVQREVRKLVKWADSTATGDSSDVPFAFSDGAWRKVSLSSDECPGKAKCDFGESCFTELARERAHGANVVVVNFSLYGLDLQHQREFLPPHEVVVFDEVHELEDVISDTASVVITPRSISNAAEVSRKAVSSQKVVNALAKTATDLDEVLHRHVGERFRAALPPDLETALRQTADQSRLILEQIERSNDDKPEALRAESTLERLQKDVEKVLASSSDMVSFVTENRNAPRLTAAPLRVNGVLAPVWTESAAILTSATIPPGLPQRLGLAVDADDIVHVASPFDYQQQSLLYLANDLPEPNASDRSDAVHRRIAELVTMSNGSALVLFTSWSALHAAVDALRGNLGDGIELLVQDDMPKKMLLDSFRDNIRSCLFATRGYFQGVDVPGDALRLVIIDKVPFPALKDPLLDARREQVGKESFVSIDVPIAAASLAQAAGRLLRTSTDHGVGAILDPRLATRRYKSLVLHGVSHMPETSSLAEVEEFYIKRQAESDSQDHDS